MSNRYINFNERNALSGKKNQFLIVSCAGKIQAVLFGSFLIQRDEIRTDCCCQETMQIMIQETNGSSGKVNIVVD